jgi:hypothetical protein
VLVIAKMQRISERKAVLKKINDMLKFLIMSGKESTAEFSNLLGLAQAISANRYFSESISIPKIQAWKEIFFHFPPMSFGKWCA